MRFRPPVVPPGSGSGRGGRPGLAPLLSVEPVCSAADLNSTSVWLLRASQRRPLRADDSSPGRSVGAPSGVERGGAAQCSGRELGEPALSAGRLSAPLFVFLRCQWKRLDQLGGAHVTSERRAAAPLSWALASVLPAGAQLALVAPN